MIEFKGKSENRALRIRVERLTLSKWAGNNQKIILLLSEKLTYLLQEKEEPATAYFAPVFFAEEEGLKLRK